MIHEFTLLYDIYDEFNRPVYNEKNELQGYATVKELTKQNVPKKWTCRDTTKISSFEQAHNKRGYPYTHYSIIYHPDIGKRKILMSYKDLKILLNNTNIYKPIGYGQEKS